MSKKIFKILTFLVISFLIGCSFTSRCLTSIDKEEKVKKIEKLQKKLQKIEEKIQEKDESKKEIEEKIKKLEEELKNIDIEKEEKREEKKEEGYKKVEEINKTFGEFEVPEDTVVLGDVNAVFSSGSIYGRVKGDLNLVFSSVFLGEKSEIDGDLNAVFSSVTKNPKAVIKGDKNFVFSSESGTTEKKIELPKMEWKWVPDFIGFTPILKGLSILYKIIVGIGYLILAILIYLFIPKHLELMNEAINKNIIRTFLFGLLATILIVPIGILFVISIVGILLIPVYVLLVILAVIIGQVVVGYLVGERFSKALNLTLSPLVSLIIGMAFLLILGCIPFLGHLMWLIITILGLGSIVLTKFGTKTTI